MEKVYSDSERARIRDRLRRYLEEHGIGVPTLCGLIEDAHPRRPEFPLSNLQRFIKNTHHTSNLYVGFCAHFLDSLNEPIEPEDFGAPLAGFLGSDTATDDATVFKGGMYSAARVEVPPADAQELAEGGMEHSALRIAREEGGSYCLVEEDEELPAAPGNPSERQIAYEGVAVQRGAHMHMMLRNVLTYRPRIYSLSIVTHKGPNGDTLALIGEGFERPASSDHDTRFGVQMISDAVKIQW